jgi:hypothetical protein
VAASRQHHPPLLLLLLSCRQVLDWLLHCQPGLLLLLLHTHPE